MALGSVIGRSLLASVEERGRGTRLIGSDSFPRTSNPRFPRASRTFEVALPDRRANFSSFVSSMPYLTYGTRPRIIPDRVHSGQGAFQSDFLRDPAVLDAERTSSPTGLNATRQARRPRQP